MTYKTDGLTYQVKAPVAKLNHPSLIPRMHMMNGENQPSQVVPWCPPLPHTLKYIKSTEKNYCFKNTIKVYKNQENSSKMLYLTGIVPYHLLQLSTGHS